MRLLKLNKLILNRSTGGYYLPTGKWVDGARSETPFEGSLQPLEKMSGSARIQKLLPEGVELDDARVIYTKKAIHTGDARTGIEADSITFNDPVKGTIDEYIVFKEEPWYGALRLSHYRLYVYLKDR